MIAKPTTQPKRLALACATLFVSALPLQVVLANEISDLNVSATRQATPAQLLLNSRNTLQGFELRQNRATSLGETLNKTSGVYNTYFGPNSGSPVVRTLSTSRVRILQNGVATGDAAVIGGNFDTGTSVLSAQKIVVEKSGAAVLYGGQAIGGAVNVEKRLIPRSQTETTGQVEVRNGSNAPLELSVIADGSRGAFVWHFDALRRSAKQFNVPKLSKASVCYNETLAPNHIYTSGKYAGVNTRLRDLCQVHAFAQITSQNINSLPYMTPGADPTQLSSYRYRPKEEWKRKEDGSYEKVITSIPNPTYDENAPLYNSKRSPITDRVPTTKGVLTNSGLTQYEVAFGGSYVNDAGYVGAGVELRNIHSGIPGFSTFQDQPKDGPVEPLLPAAVSSAQKRLSLEGGIQQPLPALESARVQVVLERSRNRELLGERVADTLDIRSRHVRLSAEQKTLGRLKGHFGVEWRERDLTSSGRHRYLPSVISREKAVFLLENVTFGKVTMEAGFRAGSVSHTPETGFQDESVRVKYKPRNYQTNQQHGAIKWQATPKFSVNAQISHLRRAPEVNELYADGAHFAIWSVEGGDDRLLTEHMRAKEIGLEWNGDIVSAKLSHYRRRFENYTFLRNTGLSRDAALGFAAALPNRQWTQIDARINGIEAEVNLHFNVKKSRLSVGLIVDHAIGKPIENEKLIIRAGSLKLDKRDLNGAYLAHLPANRYGLKTEWQYNRTKLGVTAFNYRTQSKRGNIGINNQDHDFGSYTLVDAYLGHTTNAGRYDVEWFLDVRNLTNREARPFNSPLKYIAPLPARSISAGVKVSF